MEDKSQKKDEQDSYWVMIPPTVLNDRRLSAGEKLVYGRVLGLVRKHGYCWASNEYIGKQINLSKNTVKNYISALYKHGYFRFELLKDESGQVVERRVYPTLLPNGVIPPLLNRVIPITNRRTPGSTESNREERKRKNVNRNDRRAAYFAEVLADILNDTKSITFYRHACQRHDPHQLIQKAKEIIADGAARNPPAVFVAWLRKTAANGAVNKQSSNPLPRSLDLFIH